MKLFEFMPEHLEFGSIQQLGLFDTGQIGLALEQPEWIGVAKSPIMKLGTSLSARRDSYTHTITA